MLMYEKNNYVKEIMIQKFYNILESYGCIDFKNICIFNKSLMRNYNIRKITKHKIIIYKK